MTHTPKFDLRTQGGVCAGQQWICDHDQPIARLQNDIVEQPEQNLRYFNGILKPVELREIKLAPDQRPLVGGLQLYWKMGAIATTELRSIEVCGRGSQRLEIRVTTRDPGGVATSLRIVFISYDSDNQTYRYEVEAHLDIHSPEFFDAPEHAGSWQFEYCDPWYADLPAPVAPFPGMWETRHSRLLAETPQGIWQMPLNHMATSIPSPQSFAPNGRLVLADDPEHNPAFTFLGATAQRTSIGVCNWGYDIHFVARYTRDELYAPICETFSLERCSDRDVETLRAQAAPVPAVQYSGHSELPIYERKSSFAVGLNLSEPSPPPTDPWPWLPAGEGTKWCKTEGRSDSYSLQITREEEGLSEWSMNREGDGAWLARWTQTTGFRITVYISTRELVGRGAYLAVRWAIYNEPERYPFICSERITGTAEWTRVCVEIHGPPPPDSSSICIALRQDGTGTTLFDDLDVQLLEGA